MSLEYYLFYLAAVWAFVTGPPIINPHDPLELAGPFEVLRVEESVPFDNDGDVVALDAELFIPQAEGIDAWILFMPGFGLSYAGYTEYLDHFASHGFLAVGMDFNSPAFAADGEHDVLAQQALSTISYIQETYPEYKDLAVYTAGHSLGGKIAFFAASLTPNDIHGVMGLDPVNSGGGPCLIFPDDCRNDPVAPNTESGQEGIMREMNQNSMIASLIFRSEPDPLTNPDAQFNAENFYFGSDGAGLNAAPSPTWYYDFGPFPHALYPSSCSSEQVKIMKRTMVAFIFQQVYDLDVEEYLTGEIIQKDIKENRLESVETR